MAHVVAVEHIRVSAQRKESLFQEVRNSGLAGPRQTGKPQDARLLILLLRVRTLVDVDRLPVNVLRPTQCKVDEAGADRVVREAIDQNEAAGVRVLVIRIK